MQVPENNEFVEIFIDADDEGTSEILKPTPHKPAGEDITDEQIEDQSGINAPPKTDEITDPGKEPKKPTAKQYRRSAEGVALGVDFVAQLGMGFAINLKALSVEERRTISKCRRIFKARKKTEDDGYIYQSEIFDDESMEALYHRWADISDYKESEMPLEDDEMEDMVTAYQNLLEFYQKEPGPWAHFFTVAGAIYGKRTVAIVAL